MNVADKYCKERAVSDNLRAQLKQALDENARLARELSEAKREGRKASRGGRPPSTPGRAFQARRRRGITHGAAGPLPGPRGPPGRRPSRGGRGVPGLRPLNARRNAKNFTREQLEEGVAYCHLRG